VLVLLATTAPGVLAQEPVAKLRLEVPAPLLVPQRGAPGARNVRAGVEQPASRALHPAAKGAIIGGAR
jgi:hypothetical protein